MGAAASADKRRASDPGSSGQNRRAVTAAVGEARVERQRSSSSGGFGNVSVVAEQPDDGLDGPTRHPSMSAVHYQNPQQTALDIDPGAMTKEQVLEVILTAGSDKIGAYFKEQNDTHGSAALQLIVATQRWLEDGVQGNLDDDTERGQVALEIVEKHLPGAAPGMLQPTEARAARAREEF